MELFVIFVSCVVVLVVGLVLLLVLGAILDYHDRKNGDIG